MNQGPEKLPPKFPHQSYGSIAEHFILARKSGFNGKSGKDFFNRIKPLMVSTALKYVNGRENLEDALQFAKENIVTRAKTFNEQRPTTPWIREVTKNAAIDILRKNARQAPLKPIAANNYPEEAELKMERIPDARQSPHEELVDKMLMERLEKEINGLRSSQIPTARRYFIEGKSSVEIAKELNLSKSSITSKIRAVREHLANRFRDYDPGNQ